jgi:hypothetical protein
MIDFSYGLFKSFRPFKFMTNSTQDNLEAAFKAASYIEQLMAIDMQWIWNRMAWLFTSQSFCLTAFAVVVTRTGNTSDSTIATVLKFALPILGMIVSATVGLGIFAAGKVGKNLADERAKLTAYINTHIKELNSGTIPQIGVSPNLRPGLEWTIWAGGLPQKLPLALFILWLVLLFSALR